MTMRLGINVFGPTGGETFAPCRTSDLAAMARHQVVQPVEVQFPQEKEQKVIPWYTGFLLLAEK